MSFIAKLSRLTSGNRSITTVDAVSPEALGVQIGIRIRRRHGTPLHKHPITHPGDARVASTLSAAKVPESVVLLAERVGTRVAIDADQRLTSLVSA